MVLYERVRAFFSEKSESADMKTNKRAKMPLNRSHEFKSSNTKPSVANFKHLSQVIL